MIKPDAPIMQINFQDEEIAVAPERRALLACKGQRLYAKYCGTNGKGICAESFAEYHIWRGEWIVARDLLVFLHIQVEMLHAAPDRQPQLAMTERLIARITALLGDE
jgi:hypothetical protein